MKERSVLFTFDYELFLGARSGRARDCLIEPTGRLLELMGKFGFRGVFFVDTVYLIRLEELAAGNEQAARDLADIRGQLEEIVGRGHAIFPHIHAHWIDATYSSDRNEWTLENMRYYQFASLDKERQQHLFERSMQIIGSVTDKIPGASKIDSYRAGGWSIQPFSQFKPYFLRYGITDEWSVIPGKYHLSDAHSFDFRGAPAQTPVYRFEEDPAIQDDKGSFREWTISTICMTSFEKWVDFKISGLIRRLGKKEPAKGSTVGSTTIEEGDIYQRGRHRRMTASFEGLNPFTLRKYLSAIRKAPYFQFISHPKLLSSFELAMIERLFSALHKKYNLQTDFRKVTF